ncbi:hypothetical protein [Paenibacillus cremeus]|uniref:hypothetical protein n=1 Tax=Paenibacillus cremeus TaxID=2163881 RepID=UPI0016441C64|nr:hypothetical protein [Paenibacillus cremeus]
MAIDLAIPIEETIGAISDLVQDGYVKHIGVTQVDADTLRHSDGKRIRNRSCSVWRISSWLARGTWTKEKEDSNHAYIPLFFKENIDKNLSLVEAVREIAAEKQITLSQLAMAWMLSKGEDIIPLDPRARDRQRPIPEYDRHTNKKSARIRMLIHTLLDFVLTKE